MNFSKLGNKYVLLDLIGIGGMAEVYRCKLTGEKGFEKIIVLKKLLSQVANDSEVVSNFIDEARLAAYLQHENIAHIYDFGEIDGNYFITMEYLFGKDLFTVIQRAKESGQPIPADIALYIAAQICAGMDYADVDPVANFRANSMPPPKRILISLASLIRSRPEVQRC